MDRSREYVSAHLDVSPGEEKRLEMPSAETPFRILLLCDFSGSANRAAPGPRLRGRKPIAVDQSRRGPSSCFSALSRSFQATSFEFTNSLGA